MIMTTLKDLRKAGACIDGYNKLVCSLSGKQYDPNIENYIRYKHDAPILLTHILESNGFADALWALRASTVSDRDARLFAVWCARLQQHLLKDSRSIRAIDVAEAFANGLATLDELEAAELAAEAAARAAWAAVRAAEAAEAAARAAAFSAEAAAWAAVRAQKEMFTHMCNGTAPWQKESLKSGFTL